jgi:Ca2+-transporting ATPase
VYTKGAVERLLGICSHWYGDAAGHPEKQPLEKADCDRIFETVNSLASEGLRVLAFAQRNDNSTNWTETTREVVEQNLTFLGLVGIYDPPREESAGAVKQAHLAGINVHMLTGDHPGTAKAIAQEVGILPKNLSKFAPDVVESMVVTATQFDAMSDEQIDAMPLLPLVIARCAPQTKVRMIDALHRRKAFTAMTGDGVNDSPSLKRADVGIAMGIAGSDVAKDVSDIVLSDDNFASIMNAVEEGRRMSDNIQKFALHLLAGNIAQAAFLVGGLGFKDVDGFSVFPLSPVEVLWIIMITSSFPAMGLGQEQAEPDIMRKRPRDPRKSIFTTEIIIDMLVYGVWLAIINVVTFVGLVYGKGDGELGQYCNEEFSDSCKWVFRARSTAFVEVTWALLFLAWEIVDMRRSMFCMTPGAKSPVKQCFKDIWRNQLLFWSIVGGFVTVFPIIYIPVINYTVFKHSPITWEWGVAFVGLIVFMIGVELWKWAKRVYFRHCGPTASDSHDSIIGQHFERYNTIASSASVSA